MTRRETSPATSGSAPPPPMPALSGWVTFIGAGYGDPSLLTLRAVEAIREADVIITETPAHEAMVRKLLDLPAGGEFADTDVPRFINAGFGSDGELMAYPLRAKIVAQHGRSARVARLISGDPFVFASGPEEASACVAQGIGFDVIPGVSALSATPTFGGMPFAPTPDGEVVVLVASDRVAWEKYVDAQTLVVLSAGGSYPIAVKRLLAAGADVDTPVAFTVDGAQSSQRTIVTTLGQAIAEVKPAKLPDHVVMTVGDAVRHHEKLSWFESKPLFGWRVLVPRTKEQSAGVLAKLRAYGAVPEEVPTISVEPPRNPQQMDKAVRGLVEGRYEWVVFTSANAVKAVREKLEEYGLDARAFSGLKLAAVGEKTADSLRAWGLRPDLVPSNNQSAVGLLEVWPEYDADLDPINRVFLPRADIATESLVAGMTELGWECEETTAYRTVRASPPPAPVREAIKTGKFDAVLFTSSSTVRNLVGIAGKPHATTVIAAIGPQTAKSASEHGLRVDVVAGKPDAEEQVDALADFARARREDMLSAGLPVTKPSQRRPGSRRRA